MGDILLEHAKSKFDIEERGLQQTEYPVRKKQEIIQQVSCMMGRAQAFGYMSQFSSMAELATLKEVKDNKLYREFGTGTWEEFCEMVGTNRRTIDDRLLNLERFGLAFMESTQKIGLTRQDLRRIQALPSDTRVDAINAATSLDNPTKEQVRDLLDRIEDQAADNAMLKNDLKKSEDKLSKKDAAITRGQDQVTELEDKIRVIQKQQDQSIIRNDEQASLDVMDTIRRNFHMELLRTRSIDLDTASPGIKAILMTLLDYMGKMLRNEYVSMSQEHPEIDGDAVWDVPGFVNPWEERVAAENEKIAQAADQIKARRASAGRR